MSNPVIRSSLRRLFGLILRVLTRVEVEGLDNIPSEGGFIMATNHLSVVDPVLVFVLLERDDVTALVAKKHLKNPLFRVLVDAVGGIWLNREEADSRALRAAIAHLKGGGVLGISPEGTRSHTRALIQAKTGVAYLADKAGVPIVPAALIGTEGTFEKLLSFKRPSLIARFGKPFMLLPITRHNREADLQRNTDEIMSRIAVLLPAVYHGVYADHPRVRDLLVESRTVR